jgi:Domain of unknown function DUF29
MTYTTDRAMHPLYDRDLVRWAAEQAALLRARKFHDLDIENLAQEVEDLGKSERGQLENRIVTIIEHMLKLDVFTAEGPGPRAGWNATIRRSRRAVEKLLNQNPSLKREVDAIIKAETQTARELVAEGFADYGEQPKSLASHIYQRHEVLPFLPPLPKEPNGEAS